MVVHFHPHAQKRMEERGTTKKEVEITLKKGERFLAKFGRTGFRRNFSFENKIRDKYYYTKQVEAYAVQENSINWLVITVITRYF